MLGLGLPATAVIGDEATEMGSALPQVQVEPGLPIQDIQCGYSHCCALLVNDALKCWGANSSGQLGLGDEKPRGLLASDMGGDLAYVNLGKDASVTSYVLGAVHSCAQLKTGKVKCWGGNVFGQVGIDKTIKKLGSKPQDMGENLPSLVFSPPTP